jgi:hypothetical protein
VVKVLVDGPVVTLLALAHRGQDGTLSLAARSLPALRRGRIPWRNQYPPIEANALSRQDPQGNKQALAGVGQREGTGLNGPPAHPASAARMALLVPASKLAKAAHLSVEDRTALSALS